MVASASSSSISSIPSSSAIGMPEPQPYIRPSAAVQQSHDPQRRVSNTNGAFRRLPVAPEAPTVGSSSYDTSRGYGLPSNPRVNRPPMPSAESSYGRLSPSPAASPGSSRSPLPSHPYATATPLAESASSLGIPNTNGTSLSRSDSARPKGALAPSVPGQSGAYLFNPASPANSTTSSADFYASSPASELPSPTVHLPDPPVQTYRPIDPALRGYSPSHISASLLPNGSQNPALPRVASRVQLEPSPRSSADDLQNSSAVNKPVIRECR